MPLRGVRVGLVVRCFRTVCVLLGDLVTDPAESGERRTGSRNGKRTKTWVSERNEAFYKRKHPPPRNRHRQNKFEYVEASQSVKTEDQHRRGRRARDKQKMYPCGLRGSQVNRSDALVENGSDGHKKGCGTQSNNGKQASEKEARTVIGIFNETATFHNCHLVGLKRAREMIGR